jgi:hypothetical protein
VAALSLPTLGTYVPYWIHRIRSNSFHLLRGVVDRTFFTAKNLLALTAATCPVLYSTVHTFFDTCFLVLPISSPKFLIRPVCLPPTPMQFAVYCVFPWLYHIQQTWQDFIDMMTVSSSCLALCTPMHSIAAGSNSIVPLLEGLISSRPLRPFIDIRVELGACHDSHSPGPPRRLCRMNIAKAKAAVEKRNETPE